MFVVQNFVVALAQVLGMVLQLYSWIVIISALLTWVNPDPYNPIVRFLRSATEPVYYRLRRAIPILYTSGIDFSPLVVLLLVQFLQIFLVNSLYGLANRLPG